MTTFEEILARDGTLVYKTRGVSMEPMLRQNRDLVIIQVPSSRLQKYDVALYRRGEKYVLHRVLAVRDGRYLIRGDNTFAVETVPDSAVIGVMSAFVRKGKKISVTDGGYRAYVLFWHAIYPPRKAYVLCRRFAVGAARRLGILPLLKRLVKHG